MAHHLLNSLCIPTSMRSLDSAGVDPADEFQLSAVPEGGAEDTRFRVVTNKTRVISGSLCIS
ncbi:Protein of unknown function [Pyronema omphalodes CBS 100304]|uniref:Uncharacterized protein n=1 Tax=Pyronema omphalodes (strain CBS 100304) TaxID=1076935 RepID=U4LL30_PYROM|nr:Protein of unknown function [Pyronema omphalodes CBS 100304]